jgi:hypothetical protein
MKRVYLDNNVISAMGKDDMPAQEASPISIISAMFDAGEVILYTSEVTMEELSKWQGDKKPKVLLQYQRLPLVPYIERQKLQGFQTYMDRRTFLAWPMIEDHPDWSKPRQNILYTSAEINRLYSAPECLMYSLPEGGEILSTTYCL